MKDEVLNGGTEFLSTLKRTKRARYSFATSENKEVLVLAPHADDETIGCGGTLHKLISRGVRVEVILFTNESDKEYNRVYEFTEALKVIGCHKFHVLKNPDGELAKFKEESKKKVLDIIEQLSPGVIFSPYLLDDTPDHKATNLILFECLLEKSIRCKNIIIAMYEVWSPINYADYYIDISDVFELKELALTCYKSQERKYRVISKAKKLNAFRADLSFRRNIEYMEAFKSLNINGFISIVEFLCTNGWFEI